MASSSTSRLPDIRQAGHTLPLATEIHGVRAERYISALKVLSQVLGSEYAEKPTQYDENTRQDLIRTSSTAPLSKNRGENLAATANGQTSLSNSPYGFTGVAA